MDTISSIRDLIGLWPTRASLADDLRALSPGIDVTTARVHKWAENGAIPARYQLPVLMAGRRRGFDLSAELILRLHAPRSGEPTPR